MLDLAAVAARFLLVIGCSCAALMPSALGAPVPSTVTAPVVLSPAVAVVEPTLIDDPIVPEARDPSARQSAEWQSPEGQPPPAVVPESPPTDEPLRFNRAEQIRHSPVWLRIPSLDIHARIVPVGINPDGEMEAPASYDQVAWYRHGAYPGDVGRSVLAGHYDSQTGAAVFYDLGLLQAGDEIQVELADGEIAAFAVREVLVFPVEDAPLADIFGHVDRPELVLITCAGEFRGPDAGYSHRAVVYAEPVSGP